SRGERLRGRAVARDGSCRSGALVCPHCVRSGLVRPPGAALGRVTQGSGVRDVSGPPRRRPALCDSPAMGDSVGHGRRHTPVHSVLARGQRCLLAGWLAALLACLAWVGTGVATPWAWCAVLWLLGAHPLVLGVELLCARLVHGDDPAPRPAWRELARAWWIEWGWSLRVF